MNKLTRMMSVATFVLSLVLALGVQYVFHACGPKEDGTFMACHWAQQVTLGLGLVLAVQALVGVLVKTSAARAAVSAAMIPTAVLAIAVPGGLVHLCMMADMQCQSVMKPAVRLVAGVILVCVVVTAALGARKDK